MPAHATSSPATAADGQQHERFGHELADQPARPAPSACRIASSRCSGGGLREKQIRDVGARDEQQEQDRTEQHVERRADAAA